MQIQDIDRTPLKDPMMGRLKSGDITNSLTLKNYNDQYLATQFISLGEDDTHNTTLNAPETDLTSADTEKSATPGNRSERENSKQENIQNPLDRAREDRLALMAMKYEGSASSEDLARIKILTVRLRRLDPRITQDEISAAEQIVGTLEIVSGNLDRIRAELGI